MILKRVLSKTAFMEDFLLYCFIKNSLYRPLSKRAFFALLLYQKRPLLVIFGLYWSLSIIALIKHFSLSQEWPLSRIFCFITLSKNGLYRHLSAFIKNGLFRFIALSFIENGLYWPLSQMAFFTLSLYLKQPLSAFIGLY